MRLRSRRIAVRFAVALPFPCLPPGDPGSGGDSQRVAIVGANRRQASAYTRPASASGRRAHANASMNESASGDNVVPSEDAWIIQPFPR